MADLLLNLNKNAERTLKERQKEYFDARHTDHLHKIRKLSKGSYAMSSKQLQKVKHVLEQDRNVHLNRVEREWEKRKKRRQLGIQHRRLQTGWMFLNFMKSILPRRIRPDNFLPDYIFYICNTLIFLAASFRYGACAATHSFEILLVTFKIISGKLDESQDDLPLVTYASIHNVLNVFIMLLTLVGCNIIYAAFRLGIWIYFFLMLGVIVFQAFLGLLLTFDNQCHAISEKVKAIFTDLVHTYYFTVHAIDEAGRKMYYPDGSEYYIRNYKNSSIMDDFQRRGQCCGSSSYFDYFQKPASAPKLWKAEVPQSCCTALWNQNVYCAKEMPIDKVELDLKINQEGCAVKAMKMCEVSHHLLGEGAINTSILYFGLFLICCMCMIYQLRQIRQLERLTHFNIPADSTNQPLPVSEANQRKRLIEVLSLDPDQFELSDDLLEAINKIRRGLGLEDLGKKFLDMKADEPPSMVEPPYVPEDKPPEPEAPYKQAIKNVKKGAIRTRLDIFELDNLIPYYKGMFSATFQQENQAVKNKLMKDLRRNATKYHGKDRWYNKQRAIRRQEFAKKKADETSKREARLALHRRKVWANPKSGVVHKNLQGTKPAHSEHNDYEDDDLESEVSDPEHHQEKEPEK